MKRLGDENGQALIVAALGLTCLLGFVALAADVGIMFREKRLVQIAADSGAIAGAAELNYGDTVAAAKADTAKNGFTDNSNGATVTVSNPLIGPTYGPYAGNKNYVEVIVSQSQPTIFMRLFSRNSMKVTARAVATLGNGANCIYTLGTTGTDISLSSGTVLSVINCGIIDNSSSAGALTLSSGAKLSAQSIGVVGGSSITSGATTNVSPVSIFPTSDPLAFLPEPSVPSSCPSKSYSAGSRTTISAGCYGGLSISSAATVNLNPGTYVIDGALSLSSGATITGTGVTLYITNSGSVNISSGVTVTLTAPTGGTYNGILFFQDRNDSQQATFSSGATEKLKGIFYFPDAAVSMSSGSSSQIYAAFVSKTLTSSSGFTFQDYASLPGTSSPLTSVRLAE